VTAKTENQIQLVSQISFQSDPMKTEIPSLASLKSERQLWFVRRHAAMGTLDSGGVRRIRLGRERESI